MWCVFYDMKEYHLRILWWWLKFIFIEFYEPSYKIKKVGKNPLFEYHNIVCMMWGVSTVHARTCVYITKVSRVFLNLKYHKNICTSYHIKNIIVRMIRESNVKIVFYRMIVIKILHFSNQMYIYIYKFSLIIPT